MNWFIRSIFFSHGFVSSISVWSFTNTEEVKRPQACYDSEEDKEDPYDLISPIMGSRSIRAVAIRGIKYYSMVLGTNSGDEILRHGMGETSPPTYDQLLTWQQDLAALRTLGNHPSSLCTWRMEIHLSGYHTLCRYHEWLTNLCHWELTCQIRSTSVALKRALSTNLEALWALCVLCGGALHTWPFTSCSPEQPMTIKTSSDGRLIGDSARVLMSRTTISLSMCRYQYHWCYNIDQAV